MDKFDNTLPVSVLYPGQFVCDSGSKMITSLSQITYILGKKQILNHLGMVSVRKHLKRAVAINKKCTQYV